jgi:hypothetical protein
MNVREDKLASILKHGELKHITYDEYFTLSNKNPDPHVKSHFNLGHNVYIFKYSPFLAHHSKTKFMLCLLRDQNLTIFVTRVFKQIELIKKGIAEREICNSFQIIEN